MVEFRLYYDENGDVLFYTCEDLPGNYIVVDAQTYAECRFDIRIVEQKIVKLAGKINFIKVVPNVNGVRCAYEDNAILVDEDYLGKVCRWEAKIYEL